MPETRVLSATNLLLLWDEWTEKLDGCMDVGDYSNAAWIEGEVLPHLASEIEVFAI